MSGTARTQTQLGGPSLQRSRMQMHARIEHARLPATLRYALTYRRDD
jgi:hypothetical protein